MGACIHSNSDIDIPIHVCVYIYILHIQRHLYGISSRISYGTIIDEASFLSSIDVDSRSGLSLNQRHAARLRR